MERKREYLKKMFVMGLIRSYFVNTKAKNANLKTEVTRKQSTPNFQKNEHFYPLIRTRACAYQGVRNAAFRKIWRALFSYYHGFEIRLFALLPTIY